ncbi:PREDICTED: clathrin interactor 1-like [Camelina sativa]|uniref:Clathrin interactor 1-like n=1 Tax=Camelina sativa TaxID=90675 RepID=A0ABM0WSV5_CAMSA|nr:PREDICTED: clathrin interactor 1-like [Camelina sativa]XP_010475677.1 PREDICTED: clathrin interactor 1-like [Camelina sativa]
MSKLMQNPVFHELKKQASFFIKEKIKTARLAVTDVTAEELLTEEITGSAHLLIDARSMAVITRASFEVDQFQRILRILRQRMVMFDRREWRGMYNTLSMLNHLLINGPLSVFNEFQHERVIIEDVIKIEWLDEKGFDCGVKVQNIAEKVLRLLEDDMFLKDERERTRKQSIGRITGFGNSSFVTHSETNKGRDNKSFTSDEHQTCENDRIADDHPFVENEQNSAQLLLSSSI